AEDLTSTLVRLGARKLIEELLEAETSDILGGRYNGPTKLDTKTARFKLHLRAWDGFGSSTHQVSRQRLFWNCSKKRVAYRSCRRSMGSILRNFTGGARRRWKSCRRFSPENPVGKKRRPVTMNASTS